MIRKLIKSLEAARGNGTSMISLIIPPRDQIARCTKMLADEFGTASNIKSRVNRLSVLGAITSTQQRLKVLATVLQYHQCFIVIQQSSSEWPCNLLWHNPHWFYLCFQNFLTFHRPEQRKESQHRFRGLFVVLCLYLLFSPSSQSILHYTYVIINSTLRL